MKKVLAILMAMLMSMSLLAGCGGSEPAEQKSALATGYWVVEKLVLEGSEFDKETIEELFGSCDAVMTLAFDDNGNYNGVYFGEPLKGAYTGTEDALEIDFAGETGKAVCKDGVLEITCKDGSFTLKNQAEMPETLASNPWVTYDPEFDSDATMLMSNFMNYGRYIVKDDVLYGLTHSTVDTGALAAIPFYMKGDFPEFEETKILDDAGSALYMCTDDDYLYYLRDWEAVCRVKMDGSDGKVLYNGTCDYLQIHDGRLYFADADYHFVSTDMDGKDLQMVVDKEIYYPYFICSDWMVFQDDADDESLHLYNTSYGTEVNITDGPAFNPVMDGNYLYYTDIVDNGYRLNRVDMSDPENFRIESSENILLDTVFMIDDVSIYTTNNNSWAKEDWMKLKDEKSVAEEIEMYVSEDYTVHHEFDAEGLIQAKYLMSKEKFGGSPFR